MMRNLPDHYSNFKHRFMGAGAERRALDRTRTVTGLGVFRTTYGHLIFRGWGHAGSALCGATVKFSSDPVNPASNGNLQCCRFALVRMLRKTEVKA